MIQSIIFSKDFINRVNVVVRNQPLTGKFSYTLWDVETGTRDETQTQFETFEEASQAAARAVKNLITVSATNAEARLIKELNALKPWG